MSFDFIILVFIKQYLLLDKASEQTHVLMEHNKTF